jgi:shikimate dehydrogenase
MPLYGLIGFPLSHSFSKGYFTEKFIREGIADCRYELFPLENISALPQLIADHPDLGGLNVTIPYKEAVIPYLTHLDDTAREIGAVNCIRLRDGQLTGFNTDAIGFADSLRQLAGGHWAQPGRRALILGTGGASKAVAYVLQQFGVLYQYVSRRPRSADTLAYTDLETLESFDLIVNTSPLGMYPHTDACPDLPYLTLNSKHLTYDLVYNPEKTIFLQKSEAQGASIENGLAMLYGQAEAAWEIWNNDLT